MQNTEYLICNDSAEGNPMDESLPHIFLLLKFPLHCTSHYFYADIQPFCSHMLVVMTVNCDVQWLEGNATVGRKRES
jgi:hypothetical protein